ncbi:MAG: hypothetical protein PF450_06260 [Bacteroidales bacterium]|jgi:hypothetical protein|nr:hypothetical protein [Bacteroidales bacterium]
MSDLEKYMVELRNEMDTEEPEKGHMDRFSKKLKKDDPRIRRINFRHAIQIAASIAIIMASGVVIVKSSKGSSKVALSPVVEEFQETTTFYARQVNLKYEDISVLEFDTKQEKEMLMEELSEMDTYHKDLLKELNANPGDERVMNALIQHYQIKLQVMDQIIEQLEQVKNIKNTQNEESTI